MSSMKHKLRLAGALAVLATLVAGVACRGFFTKPVLTSISISPTAPQVELGKTQQLQVFGTFDDGSRNQVKSGISWSSSAPTVAPIDATSGIVTGAQTGTATITADAQGLTSTATATVFLSGVTAITVTPSTNSVSITTGSPANYTAKATANGTQVDITGNATWTITPTSSLVTCSFVSPNEQCSATTGATTGTYTITVGYPGTTVVGTATLTVNP
jgi:uncharacterized protein YjdB